MPESYSLNYLGYFKILRNRGVKSVIDEIKDNLLFDIINNTSTQIRDGYSNNKFKHYAPAYTSIINLSIKSLPLKIEESVFCDLGCGKGKVTILARKMGFKKVLGIEVENKYLKIAKKNEKTFFSKFWNYNKNKKINFLHLDATNYKFKNNEDVIFMFDPFPETQLKKVIKNIVKYKKKMKKNIYIIFVNPPSNFKKITNDLSKINKLIKNSYSTFIYKVK